MNSPASSINIVEGNENRMNANSPPTHDLHTRVPIAITSWDEVGPGRL